MPAWDKPGVPVEPESPEPSDPELDDDIIVKYLDLRCNICYADEMVVCLVRFPLKLLELSY